jgi:hypothetical protein
MTDDTDDGDDGDGEPPAVPYRTDDLTHEAPDGTALAIRLFRPEGAGELPVLLQRTPYGRPEGPEGRGVAARALDAGYAVAYEDVRGRGDSGGEFEPWVHEAGDGAATVAWLADRPWSTGRVGTYGGSSPGQVQLLAAVERPAGLCAIAPMFAPGDLHRADFFQDGAASALAFLTWSLDDSVAGHTVDRLRAAGRLSADEADAAHAALDDALDRVGALAASRPFADIPARVLGDALPADVRPGEVVPHWEAWVSRPTYDEFWRSFDPEPDYGEIDAPGLHVTGWSELCQHGTVSNYAGLRDRSPAPQHLVVGPWAHQDTSGEIGALDFGAAAAAAAYGIWDLHVDFFDTYVRGEPSGPFAGEGRLVETLRTTVREGAGDGTWRRHDDWPPRGARPERWRLTSDGDAATDPDDGRLVRTPPAKFEPADGWTHDPDDPVPTRGGPLCCGDVAVGPRDQRPVEARADVATYTTPALAEPLVLAGPVRADLTVAADAPDADVVATLSHATDGGPSYNLCSGIRRLRYRQGRDRELPVPDDPVCATVTMWDVHHRVPAGDRLRLSVAGSSHPRFDPHPGTADPWQARSGDVRPVDLRLFHEHDRESALTVTRL